MVSEQRLAGYIDQKTKIIHFETESEDLQQWDRHIQNVCSQVSTVLIKIKEASAMSVDA